MNEHGKYTDSEINIMLAIEDAKAAAQAFQDLLHKNDFTVEELKAVSATYDEAHHKMDMLIRAEFSVEKQVTSNTSFPSDQT